MGRGDEISFRASQPGAVPPLAGLFLLSASPSMKPCFLQLRLCPWCPPGLRKNLGKSDPSWKMLLDRACMAQCFGGSVYLEGMPPLAVPIRYRWDLGVNKDACAPILSTAKSG